MPAPEQMLESLWDTESDDVFDEVKVALFVCACRTRGGEGDMSGSFIISLQV